MIVKFFEWDQPKNIDSNLKNVKNGDFLIVEHNWGGSFVAKVLIADQKIEEEESIGLALKIAEEKDLEIANSNKTIEKEILVYTKKKIRELGLAMKIFETKLSIDEKCLVVAFIAEGRVDFRSLVRDLSVKYKKIVRFQQIGSRDEARQIGGYGICGRELCCKKFPGSLKSITTEMARCQMVSHRGTERISGACGRLMCCLGFESEQYEKLLKEMPLKGDKVSYKGEEVEVIDVNLISGDLRIRKQDKSLLNINAKDIK